MVGSFHEIRPVPNPPFGTLALPVFSWDGAKFPGIRVDRNNFQD